MVHRYFRVKSGNKLRMKLNNIGEIKMIKATIERMTYSTKIDFPCSETQLSKCLDVLNYLSSTEEMSNAERDQFLTVNNSTDAFTDILMPPQLSQ